jgi:hypothetical protein
MRYCAAIVALGLIGLAVADIIPGDWVARVPGALALGWLLCAIGLSAATSVSRERQKHTLTDLLMLPGPRRDLLRAKAIGALARGLWPAVTIAILLATAALSLQMSLASLALLAGTAAGLTLFAVGAGIWLSARCRSALNATASWIGLMAGLLIGSFLLAEANSDWVREAGQPPRSDYPAWSRVVNPLLAWGRLTFHYDYGAGTYAWGRDEAAFPLTFEDLAPALVCPLAYAAVGGLLWLAAVRRFEKEGRS